MVQSKVITVSFSEAAKMKSVFVAAFCTILAVSLFKGNYLFLFNFEVHQYIRSAIPYTKKVLIGENLLL